MEMMTLIKLSALVMLISIIIFVVSMFNRYDKKHIRYLASLRSGDRVSYYDDDFTEWRANFIKFKTRHKKRYAVLQTEALGEFEVETYLIITKDDAAIRRSLRSKVRR